MTNHSPWMIPPPHGDLILGKNAYFRRDTHKTWINNNVMVIGSSGSGKTRGIVEPNISQAYGCHIVSDPKGVLYRKYSPYLRLCGYKVTCLNFSNPSDPESAHYNPLLYCKTEQDILSLSHILCWSHESASAHFGDIFWEQSAELLFNALIGYVCRYEQKTDRTLDAVLRLLEHCLPVDDFQETSVLDNIFRGIQCKDSSFPYRQYRLFKQAADRTLRSICITASSKLGRLMTPQVCNLTSSDTLHLDNIGQKRLALFVIVSDTNRSMDMLASVFFTQLFQILFRTADASPGNRLPIPTTVIMDDFASGCYIADFDKLVSSMRSRELSVIIAAQSLAQLESLYGPDARTIVGNCDNMIYLGSDIETAKYVAEMVQIPITTVLNLPRRHEIIIRRGHMPIMTETIDPDYLYRQRLAELVPI